MTTPEKLTVLRTMLGEEYEEDVFKAYLSLAESAVLNRAFPFDSSKTMPPEYEQNQINIACYLINKRGAEGETAHSENGVSRSYESANIPESYFEGIVPMVGVPK